MLTGESGPTTGKITLNTATGAVDITKKKAFQVAKLGVARTFQNIRLFGAMSVKENVLVAQNPPVSRKFSGNGFALTAVLSKRAGSRNGG